MAKLKLSNNENHTVLWTNFQSREMQYKNLAKLWNKTWEMNNSAGGRGGGWILAATSFLCTSCSPARPEWEGLNEREIYLLLKLLLAFNEKLNRNFNPPYGTQTVSASLQSPWTGGFTEMYGNGYR